MSTPIDTPSPDPLQNLSTRELETELLTLAGHVAAAQCRFLLLLAEYDRRGGWARRVGPAEWSPEYVE